MDEIVAVIAALGLAAEIEANMHRTKWQNAERDSSPDARGELARRACCVATSAVGNYAVSDSAGVGPREGRIGGENLRGGNGRDCQEEK